MSLAQGNNTPTRRRIEPGSPDPESDALTTRPVRPQSGCERRIEVFVKIQKKKKKFFFFWGGGGPGGGGGSGGGGGVGVGLGGQSGCE